MALFEARYRNSSYQISVRNIDKDGDILEMKFDSGAVNSIITLPMLTDCKLDRKKLEENLQNKTVSRIFHSASGNQMKGYLVCVRNAIISGTVLEEFYYFLVTNVEYSVALMGDDFISCCRFSHEPKQDILVDQFLKADYGIGINKRIHEDELDDLMAMCSI